MVLYGLQVCSKVELDAPIKFLFKTEWSNIEINDGCIQKPGMWELEVIKSNHMASEKGIYENNNKEVITLNEWTMVSIRPVS